MSQPAMSLTYVESLGGALISFAFPFQGSGTSGECPLGATCVAGHLIGNHVKHFR